MNRRLLPLLGPVVGVALVLTLGLLLWAREAREPSRASPSRLSLPSARVASLSPAITDTIVALGEQARLVAISDYCSGTDRPRVGTIISPRFERLASERPDLILATRVAGSPDAQLERLAPLLALPWLTLEEVTSSVRQVGQAVNQTASAEQLAERMQRELQPHAAADAPRVLLLMGPINEDRVGYFYIRDDSLHGRLITASGYRNAMGTQPPAGQPRLSVEELLRVDPDAVLVLQETPAQGGPPLARLTPLRAVKNGRTAVLSRPRVLSMGPAVLEVRRAVEASLDRLLSEKAP